MSLHEVRIAEQLRCASANARRIASTTQVDVRGECQAERRGRSASRMFAVIASATPPDDGGGIDDDLVAAVRELERLAPLAL